MLHVALWQFVHLCDYLWVTTSYNYSQLFSTNGQAAPQAVCQGVEVFTLIEKPPVTVKPDQYNNTSNDELNVVLSFNWVKSKPCDVGLHVHFHSQGHTSCQEWH